MTAYFNIVKAPKKEYITKISLEKGMSTVDKLRNFSFSYHGETLPDMINEFILFYIWVLSLL